ncbi:MAG: MBL fold metallo-hydrolase RNA specificity domain-containing protein [Erysipelotrichaceae bacterium]
MNITFYGGAFEVTGSCYLLSAGETNVLVDCGMFQGEHEPLDNTLPFDVSQLDLVLITHAHIDHCGRVPLLAKMGYQGPIYTIGQTAKLMEIMLEDSANIQEHNALEDPSGQGIPLYTKEDVKQALESVRITQYGKVVSFNQNVSFVFQDAGHLLGSSSLQLTLQDGKETRVVVFSGDIGNINQPMIADPTLFHQADYILMESTYADRTHYKNKDRAAEIAHILAETFARGGDVIVPSFAIGRTQGLLYYLREIKHRRLVDEPFDVYVDSPLATKATQIFVNELYPVADEETLALYEQGEAPMYFKGLHFVEDAMESKELNYRSERKVIIASSGMCDAGRIVHHLKNRLGKKEDTILFVGYQAEGTLGKKLLNGENPVTILGKRVNVKAQLIDYKGLSGHADREGLLNWLASFDQKPRGIFIVHGEEQVSLGFQAKLQELGYQADVPQKLETKKLL